MDCVHLYSHSPRAGVVVLNIQEATLCRRNVSNTVTRSGSLDRFRGGFRQVVLCIVSDHSYGLPFLSSGPGQSG